MDEKDERRDTSMEESGVDELLHKSINTVLMDTRITFSEEHKVVLLTVKLFLKNINLIGPHRDIVVPFILFALINAAVCKHQ